MIGAPSGFRTRCGRLRQDWPIGWVLEDATRRRGQPVNVPSLYHFRGRDLLRANGRAG